MAHGYPDFEGEKSGLYLIPEWTTVENTDKNFHTYGQNKTAGEGINISYTIPAGKTLYITWASGGIISQNQADYDHFMRMWGYIDDDTLSVRYVDLVGESGIHLPFPKPIVIPSGHDLFAALYNWSDINAILLLTVVGYEV